ncbi:LysM peptidoglycan-binding domain-containing protein [Citrifermentans bremense]|uniref:LysM peptidoglycan-binding domain-containing protein n=1 Tax=Citrifermentans bremense TaxID=60035 RepID=UPI0004245ABA|nr:LysM peptidoglycan-binding domain-containing protein [Citrifermentans bremense]
MKLAVRFITLLLVIIAAACATQPPRFRDEASARLEQLKLRGGERLHPNEYAGTLQAFFKGDALLLASEREEADRYFELTLLKAELLEKTLDEEKAREQAARERAEEEKRRTEREKKAREEAERRAQAKAAAEERAKREAAEAERRKPKPQKEPQLVASYTVRRGESLPLIASRPEVYGDRVLWPLLYRANRDQIRDPRHIWPGQVLRIPRNQGRDDISEARRYAQEHPLH